MPRLFFWACLAFILGIAFASFFDLSVFLFWLGIALGLAFFFSGFRSNHFKILAAGLCLAFFSFGYFCFDAAWAKGERDELKNLSGSGQEEFELSGIILSEPSFSDSSQRVIVKPAGYQSKLLIFTFRYPEYRYGDQIKIKGKISKPENYSDFDYQNYLRKDGIYSTMRYPEIVLIQGDKGNPFLAAVLSFKNRAREIIYQNLSYPCAPLLDGILLGQKERISSCSEAEKKLAESEGKECRKLKEQFAISGLSHLTAVSGMHIVIICGLLLAFGLGLSLWRRQAIIFSLAFVWLFILMIGLPSSAVRAGMMGSLYYAGQISGRVSRSLRLLTIAAAFMLLLNPLLLRFDIGFQLSFLATVGMVCFGPYFSRRMETVIPSLNFFDLKQALSATLSAQVLTLPVLIYNFGSFGPYAPLANILVVPLVPLVVVSGFVFILSGFVSSLLAWLISLPLWILLYWMIFVARLVSALPYSYVAVMISWPLYFGFFILFAVLIYRIEQRKKIPFR